MREALFIPGNQVLDSASAEMNSCAEVHSTENLDSKPEPQTLNPKP